VKREKGEGKNRRNIVLTVTGLVYSLAENLSIPNRFLKTIPLAIQTKSGGNFIPAGLEISGIRVY
jgi:hypothetical protein